MMDAELLEPSGSAQSGGVTDSFDQARLVDDIHDQHDGVHIKGDPGDHLSGVSDPGDHPRSVLAEGEQASLRCTQCSLVFEDVLALLGHLDTHASRCPICRKEFTTKEFLNHHMKSHPQHAPSGPHSPPGKDMAKEVTSSECDENNEMNGKNELEMGVSPTGQQHAEYTETEETCTVTEDPDIPTMKKTGHVYKQEFDSQQDTATKNGEGQGNPADSDLRLASLAASKKPEAKAQVDKPFRCSECKYAAKCVASVHIHQRRQHPGEFTTVISTLDDTSSEGAKRKPSPVRGPGQEESEDEEVRLALQSPLPDSDDEEDDYDEETEGKQAPQEYRCSMCDFTAQDTDTVFDHQRTVHPGEWQEGLGSPDPGGQGGDQPRDEEQGEEDEEQLLELPTDLDPFSMTGRGIIAGGPSSGQTPSLYPAVASSSQHGDNSMTTKFYCSNCPAYFYESGSLRRHHQMCRNTEALNATLAQFRCMLCKRVFPNSAALVPHMLAHQRHFRAFRCSLCGYKGKFEGTIIAHIRHRHPQGPEASVQQVAGQEEINAIPRCWERLKPQSAKNGQLEADEVTDDLDLQQLFGGVPSGLTTPEHDNSLNEPLPPGTRPESSGEGHAATLDALSQVWELPDESWDTDSLQHLKLGTNYMCPECPVLFKEPYKLKRHLDSHGGVKRHVCQICQKRFTRSEHLKRHRVVHANTKPYMCGTCFYSCKRLDNLQKHQRVKHPGEQCEVVRVSKEMIEAEIAANESALGTAPPPAAAGAPDHQPMPQPPQFATLPKPMHSLNIIPMSRPAKRGRPRKISSPEDNFMFCRDPGYSGMPLPSSSAAASQLLGTRLLNSTVTSKGLQSLGRGNLDLNHTSNSMMPTAYSGAQPSTSFYPHPLFGVANSSSTSMQMPRFDISSISAAAVAASAMEKSNDKNIEINNIKAEPVGTSQEPYGPLADDNYLKLDAEADMYMHSEVDGGDNSPISCANEVSKVLAGLVNRGKYQCHVCDRPFSYLKPFKKHLLCHGTFMPYECSVCGYQAKRRDMVQDHQREVHAGQACDIHVKEPTSDMHDMMDTYIHQVPDLPPTTQAASGPHGTVSPTAVDGGGLDTQGEYCGLQSGPPFALVKEEPEDSDLSQPQSEPQPAPPLPNQRFPASSVDSKSPLASVSKIGPEVVPVHSLNDKVQEPTTAAATATPGADVAATYEDQRATSSPIVFSPQTPSTGAGLLRPRPRRLIKFKVLSSHTKAASRTPAGPPPSAGTCSTEDGEGLELPAEETNEDLNEEKETVREVLPLKQDVGEVLPLSRDVGEVLAPIQDVIKSECESNLEPVSLSPPLKRRRFSERSLRLLPSSGPDVKEEGVSGLPPLIGMAPKVPITGMRTVRPILAAQEALVINIKSHKGSPKDKQGDNHRFVCSVCDQRFAYEKPFKRHLLVHGGFEPYKCDACGHLTTSRDAMKVHQYKVHQNSRTLGITVLNPTPEMEQNLIQQGLLVQQPVPEHEEEDSLVTKSIVETTRMEQHMQAAAMRRLSATAKTTPDDKQGQADDQLSFPHVLGLRPANAPGGDGSLSQGRSNLSGEPGSGEAGDDLSDMPVDEALYVNQSILMGPDTMVYTCQLCHKTFPCASKLQRHLVSHTGIKAYECQICFKKLTRLEHLKRHLLTHGNLKPYRCSLCKFDAKRLDIVQLHQQIEHPGQVVDITYLFAPSVMLPDQKPGQDNGVREDGEFGCHVCGLRFVSMNYLVVHQKVHAPTLKPYECFICHKTFTRPEHLKRHRLVHDDTKPYRCSSCGFKTKRLDGMREHQRSRHPGTEVFIIDTILPQNPAVKRKRGRPPKFSPRDSLDGLQLLHCDKCCLAFYDQNRFDQHKLTHIPSPPNPSALTCQTCGIRVSQVKHLRRHMLLHENHIPYQCSACGYAARRTDHMKLHFRKQHPFGGAQILHIAKARYGGHLAAEGPGSSDGGVFIKDEPLDDDLAPEDAYSLSTEGFFNAYPAAAGGPYLNSGLSLEQLSEMAPDTSSELDDALSGEDEEEEVDWGDGTTGEDDSEDIDAYPSQVRQGSAEATGSEDTRTRCDMETEQPDQSPPPGAAGRPCEDPAKGRGDKPESSRSHEDQEEDHSDNVGEAVLGNESTLDQTPAGNTA